MKLKKILKNISDYSIEGFQDVTITGITANSKQVTAGNLFIAKKGLTFDGAKYIAEAIEAGAVAILTDHYHPQWKQIPQIIHSTPELIEVHIAAEYYQYPADQLFAVGITGTNGKTTTSLIIKHLLESFFGPSGLIGTIEYLIGAKRLPAVRTTPDVITNQHLLRSMVDQGCHSVVMEVTSHALMQGRVDRIGFDVTVFTQLTWDHLDYHGTMEEYCKAKSRLFQNQKATKNQSVTWAVINKDCQWSQNIFDSCVASSLTYGIEQVADLQAIDIQLKDNGTLAKLMYKNEVIEVFWPLIGRFNVYNCLAAIGVLLTQDFTLKQITEKMSYLTAAQGRLELVKNALGLKIYVDYAHTDDALKNVLLTLNEVKQGKIITVFGCGGDRDKAKRSQMARISEKYSDFSIVTSDNPRSEDPDTICQEIIKGFTNTEIFTIQTDRYMAIKEAIMQASANDLILIAGKGHEKYQIFAHQTIEFDDYQVAVEICSEIAQSKRKLCES